MNSFIGVAQSFTTLYTIANINLCNSKYSNFENRRDAWNVSHDDQNATVN